MSASRRRVPSFGVNGLRLVTPRSGVATYMENMLRSWGESDHGFEEIRVYTPRAPDSEVELGRKSRNVVVPASVPYGWWEQAALPRAHREHGESDVLVCPSYVAPLRAGSPVLLVHHGSYEAYPRAFNWWRRTKAYWLYRLSARRADVVVTVSENSKRDIVRFYDLEPDKVHVIPEGVDLNRFHPIEDPERLSDIRVEILGSDRPFLIYVGKPIERRNVSSMLRAYSELVAAGEIDHDFVFIGSALDGVSVEAIVRELGIEERVHLIGHAPQDFVAKALGAASLLVYPSDYEGFGMPVLEAMACGTPVITLDNTAFPEFAGGVALLAKNGETATLVEAIRHVLNDSALRRRMSEEGPRRARSYDWGRIASRTMRLIEALAESSTR